MSNETERAQPQEAEVTQQEENLLDQIITETRIGRDDEQREQSRRQIATLVEEVMKGTVLVSKDIEATINARIADIDALISGPDFKAHGHHVSAGRTAHHAEGVKIFRNQILELKISWIEKVVLDYIGVIPLLACKLVYNVCFSL